jgi:hypothetical protein
MGRKPIHRKAMTAAERQRRMAREAVKRERRAAREVAMAETIAAVSVQLGVRLFGAIHADPPWRVSGGTSGAPR